MAGICDSCGGPCHHCDGTTARLRDACEKAMDWYALTMPTTFKKKHGFYFGSSHSMVRYIRAALNNEPIPDDPHHKR